MVGHKASPSMRDFDYFNDDVVPVCVDDGVESQDHRSMGRRNLGRTYTRYVTLTLATFIIGTWFLWGYRDEIVYEFLTPKVVDNRGDVLGKEPGAIPHNAYVAIKGITEHRGLTQRRVRGLSMFPKVYWYFLLVGSRGVFIETPGQKDRFQVASRVAVQGRAVDPSRSTDFKEVLNTYGAEFSPIKRKQLRVIQVDRVPGQHRTGFVVAFLILVMLAVSNGIMLRKLIRMRLGHENE